MIGKLDPNPVIPGRQSANLEVISGSARERIVMPVLGGSRRRPLPPEVFPRTVRKLAGPYSQYCAQPCGEC